MTSFADIRQFLGAVRRLLHRQQAVEGLLFVAMVLLGLGSVVVVTAFVAVDWIHALRWAGGLVVGGALLAGLLRYVAMPWRRLSPDVAVARHVERMVPAVRGRVLSCIELEASLGEIRRLRRYDLGLIEALAGSTASALNQVNPSSLIGWQRSRRLFQAFLAASTTLIVTVFWVPAPFAEGARLLIYGPSHQSAPPSEASVIERDVVVGDITYTLTYPAYAQLADRVVPNSSGDLSALLGTRVAVRTTSLFEATEGAIEFEHNPHRLRLSLERGVLTGEFTVKEPGRFRFRLRSPDGRQVVERSWRSLEADPDAAPVVELLQPQTDLEVQDAQPIRLYFSSGDDFGLVGIDVVTRRVGSEDPPVRRRVASLAGERAFVGDASLDLEQSGLLPGETLEAWLAVTDNNSVAESPSVTQSRKIRIKLNSPEERHRELLEAQRALVELMVDLLGDRLESMIDQQNTSRFQKSVETQAAITQTAEGVLMAFRQVVEALSGDVMADETARADLEEILKQNVDLLKNERFQIRAAVGERRPTERAEHLAVLKRANEQGIEQAERDIILIERLVDRQHQRHLVSQAEQLRDAQRELMALLKKLKESPDEATRMAVQQRIRQLAKQIDRLMADVRRGAKPMPYENQNMDAAKGGKETQDLGQMKHSLQSMEALVRAGKLDEAMAMAEQLGRQVEELTQNLEQDLQQLASKAGGQRAAAIRKAMSDISKVAHREDKVSRETRKLQAAAEQALADKVQHELAQQVTEQLRNVDELARRYNKVDPLALHAQDKKALEALQEDAASLRETLAQGDIAEAARMARQIQKQTRSLADEVQLGAEKLRDRQGNTPRVARRERNMRRLRDARPTARRLAQALEEMVPKPSGLLNRRQRRRMGQLAEQQKRVTERLQRARDGLKSLEEHAPGTGAQLDETLKRAQESMRRARQRLQSHQPGKAREQQQQAMDQLEEARKALERSAGPPKGGGNGVGVGKPNAPVEIPDAERYAVPKVFREKLLRSMKEQAPVRYRRLIEQYYEALIP